MTTKDTEAPKAVELEMAIIGSALESVVALGYMAEKMQYDDWYVSDHRTIAAKMIDMYSAGEAADLVSVDHRLREAGKTHEADTIVEIAGHIAPDGAVESYIATVKDRAIVRRLIRAAEEIRRQCSNFELDARKLVDFASEQIFGAAGCLETKKAVTALESVSEVVANAETYAKGGLIGTTYGFSGIDECTGGMRAGDLIIVAGRPSMGKTAFALSMLQKICVEEKIPAAYFSLEMGHAQISERMVCAIAGVNLFTLRSGKLPRKDYEKLSLGYSKYSETPLWIDDNPGLNVAGLRSRVRRLVLQHGIKVVAVDHLGLMAEPGENRTQEVGKISRGLKLTAREFDIPVIALSQLSRDVAKRQNHKPVLADLRDSGDIEQDADVVMFVHRPEVYTKDPEDAGKTEILIEKQRNGPTGSIYGIKWDKGTVRFYEDGEDGGEW